MADETGLTRIEKRGETYAIEGVHHGEKIEVLLPAQSVESYERTEGRKATEAMMKRQIETGIEYQAEQRGSRR